MSEQAIRSFQPDAPETPPLTAQQWQGLARLGDISNLLAATLETSAGGTLAKQIGKVGDGYLREDFPGLLRDVLATLQSLRASGLLDALKDNAGLIMQTLDLAGVVLDEGWSRLDGLDIESLREDLRFGRATLRKTRLLAEFVEANLSADVVARLSGVLELVTQQASGDALVEALETLKHLHANGSLARLRESSDFLGDALGGVDAGEAIAGTLHRLEQLPLAKLGTLTGAAERALEAVGRDRADLGGVRGLLRLLTDREVQAGLKTLTRFVVELEARS